MADSKAFERECAARCQNVLTFQKQSLLHAAAVYGAPDELFSKLISKGISVDVTNKNGATSLHLAVLDDHENVCKLLLDRGANVNAIDEHGRTPLHRAAYHGKENLCKLFLDRGANVNVTDKDGLTPLHYAARSGRENVCKLLLDRGANINAVDKKGQTSLHLAARFGLENVCKLLLDREANVQLKSKIGQTPLDLARSNRKYDIVKLLESWIANPPPVTFAATSAPQPTGSAGSVPVTASVKPQPAVTANPRPVSVAATGAPQHTGAAGSVPVTDPVKAQSSVTAAPQHTGAKSVPPTASVKAEPVIKINPFLEDLFGKIDLSEEDKAKYKAAFIEHDITSLEVVIALDRETLRALGVTTIGHQIKLEALLKNSNAKTLPSAPTSALSASSTSRRPASYVPSAEVRDKIAAAMAIARYQRSKFLLFASHNWGPGPEFANHAKVGRLVDAFRAAKASVWFDAERLTGNVPAQVAKGIQDSAIFVAFVTKLYIEKVDAGGNSKDPDWCQKEFDYALNNKANKILTVVVEQQVKRDVAWTGPVGFLKGNLYVDFTSEDDMDRVISEMCDRMTSLLE